MKRLLAVLAAGAALWGCAPRFTGGITESYAQYCPAAGAAIAVLPFANDTADMDAPGVVRAAFIEGVQARGISMVPIEVTDEKLRENGITQGGQLHGVDPQTLKEVLGVDYVFYGNVETFSSKNIMVYVSRWVKAGFKLVYTPKGELLWDAGGEAKEREYHMDFTDDDAMKAAMVQGLVSGLVQSALKEEADLAVTRAFSTLPQFAEAGPGVGAAATAPALDAGVGGPPDALMTVAVAGSAMMPPDLEAAFQRLAANAGIAFDGPFLASKLQMPGSGHPEEMTVKLYLSALQFGIEQGGKKMDSLANWRREGNAYKVEMRGGGKKAEMVFRFMPKPGVTAAKIVDPDTGKPVRGFLGEGAATGE